MNYKLHPEALAEYIDSIKYYSKVSKSLALNFVTAIENSINQILEFPNTFNKIDGDIQKYLVKQFPYCIYYSVEQDTTIFIHAIMHNRQRPGYWKGRI